MTTPNRSVAILARRPRAILFAFALAATLAGLAPLVPEGAAQELATTSFQTTPTSGVSVTDPDGLTTGRPPRDADVSHVTGISLYHVPHFACAVSYHRTWPSGSSGWLDEVSTEPGQFLPAPAYAASYGQCNEARYSRVRTRIAVSVADASTDFVTGLQVCVNRASSSADETVQGVRLYTRRWNGTELRPLDDVPHVETDLCQNGWRERVTCSEGYAARGLYVHETDGRVRGLSLQCARVNPTGSRTSVAPSTVTGAPR